MVCLTRSSLIKLYFAQYIWSKAPYRSPTIIADAYTAGMTEWFSFIGSTFTVSDNGNFGHPIPKLKVPGTIVCDGNCVEECERKYIYIYIYWRWHTASKRCFGDSVGRESRTPRLGQKSIETTNARKRPASKFYRRKFSPVSY